MKRRMLLLIAMVVFVACMLCVTAFAQDISVEADELSDIHTAIASTQVGDSITINLINNIIIPKTSEAIKINKDIIVTINLNGFKIVGTHGGGSAGNAYGMHLDSKDCKLILNGSTTVDYINYEIPQDEKITASNGIIVNPNEGRDVITPDYASDGPAVVVLAGELILNNMYIHQYNSGEWAIFFFGKSGGEQYHDLTINNSIVRSNSSRYAALGTRNAGTVKSSLVKIENSVIHGTGNEEWLSMSAGSYIKNTRIAEHIFKIDSYLKDNYAREGNEAILQNVIFENKLTSNTGAIYVKMIDCQFVNGMNIYVVGDSQGKTIFTAIESPTCEEAGRQASIACYKGGEKTITSFDDLTLDTEVDLSPLGHEADPNKTGDIHYNSYLEDGMLAVCVRCGVTMADENIKADPLFKFLGYSTPEDGSYGIVVSYMVDYKAVALYEQKTGKALTYGIVAGAKQNLGDNNPLDKDGNVVTLDKGAVIKAEVGKEYSAYDFKLTGLGENQLDLELVMATYVVIDDGENVSVVYLQGTQLASGLGAISYNGIPNK